ncbi:hypothetical protein RclHR1_10610002 [Rhizophagus clarus]|uniref:F-box domain-containing protein n=1 Tax=Rhizophagus clarus TaxID=94130 RepID=A0A2Z6Q6L6_9GLOM|nr:hypothetical protein RclHR1_10610002 [Rhizophagus clarus]
MSKLNENVLFLIFKELQKDSKSLFSSLMVNRHWCETVIPILWRNPWRYGNSCNKRALFKIIASYYSDDTRELLAKGGLRLVSFESLLFDYLSFCTSINVSYINDIIFMGFQSLINNQSDVRRKSLQQEFYSIIMKKCPRMKYLDMRLNNYNCYFPIDRLHFESLYELKCDTHVPTYFNIIARTSQNIQKFTVSSRQFNIGIVGLIEAQKNLKYFKWNENSQIRCNELYSYNEMLLALGKKTDTIKHLKIDFRHDHHYISRRASKLQDLPKLYKLKSLIINDFRYFNLELLKNCVYHDLEIFKVGYYRLEACSIIIENSGGNLKKIFLGPNKHCQTENLDDNNNPLIFIRKVYENCPLIEYLSIILTPSKEHFSEFENLLKICQHLKSLLIIYLYREELISEETNLKNGEILLKSLIKSAPINLKEIRVCYDCKFSLESLEDFLEKWKGNALTIITNEPIYKEENYTNLINKYKSDGVIRDFIYEPITLLEHELKLYEY